MEVFTTPPFVLYFHFPWLIAGESESRVCLFCDLLRFFVNIVSVIIQIPCDQGAMLKHVMDV